MGFTGELVRGVFSRNGSAASYESKLRRRKDEIGCNNGEVQLNLVTESPDRKSMGTSVEVQTENSADG
ncbi:hypothetical protein HN51_044953 [Arachis hypogaea]